MLLKKTSVINAHIIDTGWKKKEIKQLLKHCIIWEKVHISLS